MFAKMQAMFDAEEHADHDDHVDEPSGVEQSLEELEFLRSACAAAQAGNTAKLARMLESKRLVVIHSDGTQEGGTGYTPLHYAARAGHLACVELLLSHDAEVNATTTSGGSTPLHRAAHQGHVAVVSALVAARADVTITDSDGQTALHKAAGEGRLDAYHALLRIAPALGETRDNHGRTAAAFGAEKGHHVEKAIENA